MVSKKLLDVKIILNESYIKTIRNSTGSNLHRFKLTNNIHATVEGTVKDLEKSGWQKIKRPKPGAIPVWESQKVNDKIYWHHDHIGFYIGKDKAISTSFKKGQPVLHHWTFGTKNGQPARKVEQIFWNKRLNK